MKTAFEVIRAISVGLAVSILAYETILALWRATH